MKKFVLSLCLLAPSVYAQVPPMSSRSETLVYLAKMTGSFKLATYGMLANNTMEMPADMMKNMTAMARKLLDNEYEQRLAYFEQLGEEEMDRLATFIRFSGKFNHLLVILKRTPIYKDMEAIKLAVSQMQLLLTEETPLAAEDVEGLLQDVAEMEKMAAGWGWDPDNSAFRSPDAKQGSKWENLTQLFSVKLVLILFSQSEEYKNFAVSLNEIIKKMESDTKDKQLLYEMAVLKQTADDLEAFIRLYSSTNQELALAIILQKHGDDEERMFPTMIDLQDEELELLLSYFNREISDSAFAQQYREFLHKYSHLFDAERMQEAEQRLANF